MPTISFVVKSCRMSLEQFLGNPPAMRVKPSLSALFGRVPESSTLPGDGNVGRGGALSNGDAAVGAAGGAEGVAGACDPATMLAKLGFFFLKYPICFLMSSIWSRAAFATSRAAVAMAFVSLVFVSLFVSRFSVLLFRCPRPLLVPASMVSNFSFCRSNFSLKVAMKLPNVVSILSSIFLLTFSEMSWARASSRS